MDDAVKINQMLTLTVSISDPAWLFDMPDTRGTQIPSSHLILLHSLTLPKCISDTPYPPQCSAWISSHLKFLSSLLRLPSSVLCQPPSFLPTRDSHTTSLTLSSPHSRPSTVCRKYSGPFTFSTLYCVDLIVNG